MAESILKLKIDSSEYNQKIKRAAEDIQRYADECRKAGGTLEHLDDGVEEFVRALGNMETVSKSAKGSISEMTKAFTELSVQYNRLTDEEKNAPFGKALADSLGQLKGRIQSGNQELKNIGDSLNNTGGFIDQLSSKLTVNIDATKLFSVAWSGVKAALDVAKDAFFASEQNLDDWNRSVHSAQSVYEGFLTSLNTGDVGGFLANIQNIVSAANEAYNAIDNLQTLQNIQTPKMQAKMSEVNRMETMLRTGRYIAPVDGRASAPGLKEGDILDASQKERIAQNLASAMKEIGALTRNEVQASTDAINALYREQALRLGMTNEEFRKGTASIAIFRDNVDKARKAQEWDLAHTKTITSTAGVSTTVTTGTNPYEAYKGWGVFKDDGDLFQRLLQEIGKRSGLESQYYGQMGRAYRGINRGEGISASGTRGSGSGSGSKAKTEQTELQKNQKLIADLTAEYQGLADKAKTATDQELVAADDRMTAIKSEIQYLQQRNNTLKQYGDIAEGKFDPKNIKAGNPSQMGIAMPVVVKEDTLQQQVQRIADSARTAMANTDIADPLLQNFRTTLVDSNTLGNLMKVAIDNGIAGLSPDFTSLKEQIAQGVDIPPETWVELQDKINEQLKKLNIAPIKIDFNTGNLSDKKGEKKDKDVLQSSKQILGGLNEVTSGLQQLGIELPKGVQDVLGVVNGLMSVIEGVNTIISVFQVSALTANTIALGTLTAAVTANTFSHFIPFFSNGGIVPAFANGGLIGKAAGGMLIPGNSFSGDNLRMPVDGGRGFIGVNSGELILNKAQQNQIASLLTDTDSGNTHSVGSVSVSAEQLRIVLRNGAGRRGRTVGEWLNG